MLRLPARTILALGMMAAAIGISRIGQAAETIPALASRTAADEFGGQPGLGQGGVPEYLDAQARNAQLADPTAPDSLRTHGKP